MEDLAGNITRGNVTEVKVVLASVVTALACQQLLLIAVGYGKLRPSYLGPRAASLAHRAVGDAIVVMAVVVAATALLVVLALKIAVVRWWHGLGGLLPVLGVSVFGLPAWPSSRRGRIARRRGSSSARRRARSVRSCARSGWSAAAARIARWPVTRSARSTRCPTRSGAGTQA